jgi:chemotaxis methyl-accepting protein methylase
MLREYRAAGGSLRFLACDWHAETLRSGSFNLIYCRNSLRCSTKAFYRRSLRRFHELLSPGGTLLLENVNAIGIQDEVEELTREAGFSHWTHGKGDDRSAADRFVVEWWPTG